MKKLFILCVAALFAVVSCNKEKVEPNHELTQITFNLTASHPDQADATKAVKGGWEDGDVIFVFFSGATAPMYLKMERVSGSWTYTSMNGLMLENESTGTMRAVYLPFGSDVTVEKDGGSSYTFSRTDYTYYLTDIQSYTVVGRKVTGTFDMSWPDGFVQFSMPIIGEVNGVVEYNPVTLEDRTITFFREGAGQYTLSESHLTPTGIATISADCSTITHSTRTPAEGMVGYYYGTGSDRCILFSGVLAAGARGSETPYAFTFVNNMGTGDTYDDATYMLSGTKTWYTGDDVKRAIKFPLISSSSWTVPEPAYVTVDGINWATCNMGATSPQGYGDYYTWGSFYPQARYRSEDYPWKYGKNGLNNDNPAKEKFLAYDVVYQKLGGTWRMPTSDQLESLTAKIKSIGLWTEVGGVNGWLVNADDFASTGKQLFLPAAGVWRGDSFEDENVAGAIWGSGYFKATQGQAVSFTATIVEVQKSASFRYNGITIRPVYN